MDLLVLVLCSPGEGPGPHLNSTAPLMPLYRRIGWLHMPKSGTSFGTSLAHLANASLPSDAAIGPHTLSSHQAVDVRPAIHEEIERPTY